MAKCLGAGPKGGGGVEGLEVWSKAGGGAGETSENRCVPQVLEAITRIWKGEGGRPRNPDEALCPL